MSTQFQGVIPPVITPRHADGSVSLSVEDNGPCVPDDALPRLSERFFRASSSNEEGSGLGLAIVKRIAERHLARVSYTLVEPHGLRVEVRFPAVDDGDAPFASKPPPGHVPS